MTHLHVMAPLTLYMLKREYGGAIDIYKLLTSETSARTGQKTVTTKAYHVARAVILPAGYSRMRAPGTSDTRGVRDVSVRDFIVDRKDVRGLDALTADDWIVFRGSKYQVQSVEAAEFESGWVITAKEQKGEVPEQTINVLTSDRVRLEQRL